MFSTHALLVATAIGRAIPAFWERKAVAMRLYSAWTWCVEDPAVVVAVDDEESPSRPDVVDLRSLRPT